MFQMRNSLKLCSTQAQSRIIASSLPKQITNMDIHTTDSSICKMDKVEKLSKTRSQIKGINLLRNPSYYKVNFDYFKNIKTRI